jgi:hypothetical protein
LRCLEKKTRYNNDSLNPIKNAGFGILEKYFRDAPDTNFAGYLAGRISNEFESQIPVLNIRLEIRKGRIPDIWLDFRLKIQKRADYPAGYPVRITNPDFLKIKISQDIDYRYVLVQAKNHCIQTPEQCSYWNYTDTVFIY